MTAMKVILQCYNWNWPGKMKNSIFRREAAIYRRRVLYEFLDLSPIFRRSKKDLKISSEECDVNTNPHRIRSIWAASYQRRPPTIECLQTQTPIQHYSPSRNHDVSWSQPERFGPQRRLSSTVFLEPDAAATSNNFTSIVWRDHRCRESSTLPTSMNMLDWQVSS